MERTLGCIGEGKNNPKSIYLSPISLAPTMLFDTQLKQFYNLLWFRLRERLSEGKGRCKSSGRFHTLINNW